MNIALFYHSLLSDWNHGNAHFLRGMVTELQARGHQVRVFEPRDAWSRVNLVAQYGDAPLRQFRRVYPHLSSTLYRLDTLDMARALDGVDVIIAHEWNDKALVRRLGKHRRDHPGCRLLFHDTHHRCVTDPAGLAAYDLSHYDGVLAYGNAIRDRYLDNGWIQRAWTWHEAADTRVFYPRPCRTRRGDLVWIGNWGDEERSAEIYAFLLKPVAVLGLRARVYGVRYPPDARKALAAAGITYGDWLPNYRVPQIFAQFKVTVHIPRRPYARALPGIPTIRPFEALACGIPLVCTPWDDVEHLFTPGKDFLVARNGREMQAHLRRLLHDPELAREMATHGQHTIQRQHTCAHRVDELQQICAELGLDVTATAPPARDIGPRERSASEVP